MNSYHPSWSQGYDPEQFSSFYHHPMNSQAPYNASGFPPNFSHMGVQPYHLEPPRLNFSRQNKVNVFFPKIFTSP